MKSVSATGISVAFAMFIVLEHPVCQSLGEEPYVTYDGETGSGHGKHVVLISGDEEYRSEEALPQLGKILAQHHGFKCTVLFAIDRESGMINPNDAKNIPGLAKLATADLMILFTRRRQLPDKQMQYVDDYLKSGKPVIGIRTATHAFDFDDESKWARYGDGFEGENNAWEGGFGRLVLGEHWVDHHGRHMHESTRGLIAPDAKDHPILRGIKDGDIWGPTDVYRVRLPLPGDSQPLVLGQVIRRTGKLDRKDRFYGMRPDDGPPAAGKKNDPMMPIAWIKTYQVPGGESGRAFTSTIGASADLLSEGTRRLLVNAVYWCLRMEDALAVDAAEVGLVGSYEPTRYEFRDDEYWSKRRMTLDEHRP